ncbi:MAG TPA: hypothetical protein VFN10_19595 [Thermoanaerobaculia bacterium]|nr:hypothetical protein [Thermoanaerobaculia bacterium]
MAWRLIFEAVGDELRVVRAQHVAMEAPAPPVEMPEGHGVFAEMRDADEKTLYRAQAVGRLFRR